MKSILRRALATISLGCVALGIWLCVTAFTVPPTPAPPTPEGTFTPAPDPHNNPPSNAVPSPQTVRSA